MSPTGDGAGQLAADRAHPFRSDAGAAVPVAADAAPTATVPAATVTAVYRALLGRDPDPDGLAHWASSGDLDGLLSAVAGTEEHRRRVLLNAQAGGAGDLVGGLDRDHADRLRAGDGLVALDEPYAFPRVLSTLPWEEVEDSFAALPALVLGPYGRELAEELVRRGHVGRAEAGLSAVDAASSRTAGRRAGTGTLVLTDPIYLRALTRLRPDVLDGARLRVLHPVVTRPGEPADEAELSVLIARRRLHDLGFIEVSRVFGRRHGGGTVVVDTTFAMPDPGDLLAPEGGTPPAGQCPASVWLVGRRVPVGDRT